MSGNVTDWTHADPEGRPHFAGCAGHVACPECAAAACLTLVERDGILYVKAMCVGCGEAYFEEDEDWGILPQPPGDEDKHASISDLFLRSRFLGDLDEAEAEGGRESVG